MTEPAPYGPLTTTFRGHLTTVTAPATWQVVDADFPDLGVAPVNASNEDGIDLVCTASEPSAPGFVDSCVITTVRLPEDVPEEEWFRTSTAQVMETIAGVRMIDLLGWRSRSASAGLLRLGVYIDTSDHSLTFYQCSWVETHRYGRLRRGVTATFTCPTSTSPVTVPFFSTMSETLEVH
ncbi:hypothetical protein [Actinomyces wuliandei]|uniref:hypothetical protein n=1 Tax=Actinomyces wuliandei TaxID=2057743 RepID=UPI000FDBC1A7|nr:hypothetical protein [Actinomyces wuliandei]